MSRVLVLLTEEGLEENKFVTPKSLKPAAPQPKRSYDEEVERQAFAALRSSRENFVVVFGDKVQHYHRRHDAAVPVGKERQDIEVGFLTPLNRPFIPLGGNPEDPNRHTGRFKFPPGLERERRIRRAAEEHQKELQLLRQQRDANVKHQIQLYQQKRSSGFTAFAIDSEFGAPQPRKKVVKKAATFIPRRQRTKDDSTGIGGISAIADGSSASIEPPSAPQMLDLWLSNPGKASALTEQLQKAVQDRRLAEEAEAAAAAKRREGGPRFKLDAKESVLKGFMFPRAQLEESARRVDVARKGGSLAAAGMVPPETAARAAAALFPAVDVPTLARQAPSPAPSRQGSALRPRSVAFVTQLDNSPRGDEKFPAVDSDEEDGGKEEPQAVALDDLPLVPSPGTASPPAFPPTATPTPVPPSPFPPPLSPGPSLGSSASPSFGDSVDGALLQPSASFRGVPPRSRALDPIYNYRLRQVEEFDPTKRPQFGELTPEYWHLRFNHTQFELQSGLQAALEERQARRAKVYGHAEHLGRILGEVPRRAVDWSVCRRAYTRSRGAADLWSSATDDIDQRQDQLERRVAFYAKSIGFLAGLLVGAGEPDASLQALVDHLRELLIGGAALGLPLLQELLRKLAADPDLRRCRVAWKLLCFTRDELNISPHQMQQAMQAHNLELP